MDYINIWGIAALAGVACLAFFFLLTRRIGSLFLRTLLRCLGAVWLLLPAPVPNYPGNFAPAFVVWIFEGILQSDGEPLLSIQILLWSSLAVLALVSFWYFVFGRQMLPSTTSAQAPPVASDRTATEPSIAERVNRLVPSTAPPSASPTKVPTAGSSAPTKPRKPPS